MRKTFCDICGKEIKKDDPIYYIQITADNTRKRKVDSNFACFTPIGFEVCKNVEVCDVCFKRTFSGTKMLEEIRGEEIIDA